MCEIRDRVRFCWLAGIDMSEYSEPHSVSRLVGAPPGCQCLHFLSRNLNAFAKRFPSHPGTQTLNPEA
eukprot:1515912-Rhodomonas_salina.3